jgi:hypothetical protein
MPDSPKICGLRQSRFFAMGEQDDWNAADEAAWQKTLSNCRARTVAKRTKKDTTEDPVKDKTYPRSTVATVQTPRSERSDNILESNNQIQRDYTPPRREQFQHSSP